MRTDEGQTLILYHTDLRGQWPQPAALALAARLPYTRRLAARSSQPQARASLAGIALALRALRQLLGRAVDVSELVLTERRKPHLVATSLAQGAPGALPQRPRPAADFSISHAGDWVGCAAMAHAKVGLDIEEGTDAHIADWVVREALLKASGEGLRALDTLRGVRLDAKPVRWRGESWHLQRLALFPGASACAVASAPVGNLSVCELTPAELFAT